MPLPAYITPLSINRYPNKLAPNAPNNISRNPPFFSFTSCLIVFLTSFINKPVSSRDLIIFMISSISSFEIISAVIPDPASVADAVAGNPNGIKTLLTNGYSTFFIKGKQVFINGPTSLPKNFPGSPILDK